MVMAGCDGSIKWGSNAAGYIDNFSINAQSGVEDVSSIGKKWKENLATQKSWSGSMSGTLDVADSAQSDMLDALQDAASGTPTSITGVTAEFVVSPTKKYSGTCILENISVSGTASGKVTFSASFQGTGPLTLGAAS